MSIILQARTNIYLKRKNFILGKVEFNIYLHIESNLQYIVIIKGQIKDQNDVIVRIHSECITGDLFGSDKCDCGHQLDFSYELISNNTKGVIIYIKGHEGRGIGLVEKIKAYELQQTKELDTIQANIALGHKIDLRNFLHVNDIIEILGIKSVHLISNNPDKIKAIKNITKIINTSPSITDNNKNYIYTKIKDLGHNIIVNEFKDIQLNKND
jgi:GTP cyclohydrolase II